MPDHWKRIGFYLLLNIIVSALTTWLVFSMVLRRTAVPAQVAEGGAAAAEQDPGEDGTNAQPLGQLQVNSVIGAGDIENERVHIRHVGTDEVSLDGWRLEDEQGNTFDFPALTMFSGGAVTVYSKTGNNTVMELYWGLDTAIFSEGELVILLDPDGNVQARYTVP